MEVETRSSGELISKLELISLRGSSVQPYLGARIDIVTLDPAFFSPTQRYVLTSELKKIEDLRWELLKEYNQDILGLTGYLKCHYLERMPLYELGHLEPYAYAENYPPKTIDILPPVIEEYFSPRGELHLLICDGQHRCYLAYTMGTLINVAYVRGVNYNHPYYAYPLPNRWDGVEIRDDIPQDYIKKFHVAKEHKKLYRDFNSQFKNIGDSRPRTDPNLKNVLDPEVREETNRKYKKEIEEIVSVDDRRLRR